MVLMKACEAYLEVNLSILSDFSPIKPLVKHHKYLMVCGVSMDNKVKREGELLDLEFRIMFK